ncbi:hypothetical protein GPJ56_007076 [Histomonas meleagridis]|uniref:uncharacterized protein n=1 Tax=Histomonas meleagridis TaxID=135588 RepID=UPI00355A7EC9|nr:hypothetical protein GPJ56_007076 [Histomonas meleagridis]KAH0799789.1 hypothetical protein GO595_007510 [Histomonas meleagridis]
MEPSNSKPKSQNTTSKELQDEYKNEQSISAQPSGDQQNSYISDTPSTEQIHEPQNTYDSGDAQSPRKSSPPDTYISDQSNSQNTEQTNELTNEPPLERVQLTFPLPESQSGENEDINDSALNEQNATGNETDTTENNSKEETDEKDKSESLESDFLLMQ